MTMTKVLWQNKDAAQTYRLGRFRPKGEQVAVQEIDHLWSDGGHDNIGYLKSCDHLNKIEVRGDNCVEIAEKIVKMLNNP